MEQHHVSFTFKKLKENLLIPEISTNLVAKINYGKF